MHSIRSRRLSSARVRKATSSCVRGSAASTRGGSWTPPPVCSRAALSLQQVVDLYAGPSITALASGVSQDVPLLGGADQPGGVEATLDATQPGELSAGFETQT